jgi:hypothetical protein
MAQLYRKWDSCDTPLQVLHRNLSPVPRRGAASNSELGAPRGNAATSGLEWFAISKRTSDLRSGHAACRPPVTGFTTNLAQIDPSLLSTARSWAAPKGAYAGGVHPGSTSRQLIGLERRAPGTCVRVRDQERGAGTTAEGRQRTSEGRTTSECGPTARWFGARRPAATSSSLRNQASDETHETNSSLG